MASKIKVNEKEEDGQTGFQIVGSNGITTKWHATVRGAKKEYHRKLYSPKKKKPVTTKDNETSVNPKLYGDMLERKE